MKWKPAWAKTGGVSRWSFKPKSRAITPHDFEECSCRRGKWRYRNSWNTSTQMSLTNKFHNFKLLKENWKNPGSKGLSTHLLLKSGNDLSPKPLPTHSVVAANDFATQATRTDHAMSFPSEMSNVNPSTLDSSNEASLNDSTIGTPNQRKVHHWASKKNSTHLHKPCLINLQLSCHWPIRAWLTWPALITKPSPLELTNLRLRD